MEGKETTGRDITAKDFRTWAGTMLAAKQLMGDWPGEDPSGGGAQRTAGRRRRRRGLGNTRALCRKDYLHPGLLRAYLAGLTGTLPSAAPRPLRRDNPPAALRRDEVAVLQFLQETALDD